LLKICGQGDTAGAAAVGLERLQEDPVEESAQRDGIRIVSSARGYAGLDPVEVEEARLRTQQPAQYTQIRTVDLEDLYSRPHKKR